MTGAPGRDDGAREFPDGLTIGLDVGSTSVKAVVVDPARDAIVWSDYQRHETRQFEKCLELLTRIETNFSQVAAGEFRVFATGTGGAGVGQHIGACYVQEVNALCLAVEKYYPEARSVIELGGEDAKIIVFKTNPETGARKKLASMNDKCAGGTGTVIDKISAKLGIPPARLCEMRYAGVKRHPVAGKCGVFAETDINGLQKQGVPAEELMASLFESIVVQNLSVLTRGNTLHPSVLLLGGPNTFLPGMQECWRRHIPRIWAERGVPVDPGKTPEELIFVPANALLFAAIGAVEFAKGEMADNPGLGVYSGTERLRWYIEVGRVEEHRTIADCGLRIADSRFPKSAICNEGNGRPIQAPNPNPQDPRPTIRNPQSAIHNRKGLVENREELAAFTTRYARAPWRAPQWPRGTVVEAFIGVDGGIDEHAKAVLLDDRREVIAKAYQLSKGNPIEDTKEVCASLRRQMDEQGCTLRILGVATTGYAKDILKDVLGADVALVETVAHMQSGLQQYPRADVICDVGGQDIKIIMLKNGVVKDFRLNTQCSAGNGYYLQATAATFGYSVEEYADVAFTADSMPMFGHGCVVFLQSDIVDFQRKGWKPNEIMAGLADVLPRNIWLYVCQIPNLARLGSTFVLQGGTQHNLAAVKAQVDYIRSRFRGSGVEPEIVVHPHCGESGAIGCALEARRRHRERGYRTTFIGFDALASISYTTRRDEDTRCRFCANQCVRTFLDLHLAAGENAAPEDRRIILANCEQGAVENLEDMRAIRKRIEAAKDANPNLVAVSAREVFQPPDVASAADPAPRAPWFAPPSKRRAVAVRAARMRGRAALRIGIPRAINMYSCGQFFLGYFMSLGVPGENIVWSDYTTETLYREGARRGSIDPCYPSKLAIPHVHNLLFRKHTPEAPLTHIFFPLVNAFPTWLEGVVASRACPSSMATPESAYAAFVKESDVFAERGIRFKRTYLDLGNPALSARLLFEDWAEDLGLSEAESLRAVREGLRAMQRYQAARRREAREILDMLERERRLGVVILARPYHNDPGINHGVCEEFQKLGYPVLTHDSLPTDEDLLESLFGDEIAAGVIPSGLHIDDVWKHTFAENSSRKLWAAKYAARHPNLVALELSNFKCGHDAPIYSAIEEIVERSGTPFFYFKDIDENRPAASIKIRIQTIAYFLERYTETLARSGALSGTLARVETDTDEHGRARTDTDGMDAKCVVMIPNSRR